MKLSDIRYECESQAEYLQVLCNKFGDFKIATTYKDGTWTKHYSVMECWHGEKSAKSKYSDMMWRLDIANQRQILSNEIVFDIDSNVENTLKLIVKLLNRLKLEYDIFSTGSRGYHIHVLFNSIETDDLQNLKRRLIGLTHSDMMKMYNNTMIALEFAPHWKSGKIKGVFDGSSIK